MRSTWITNSGKRVLYLNYSGFKSDLAALRAEVEAADQVICSQRPSSVLALADLRDTVASSAVVDLFKRSATQTSPYMSRLALIGIHGLKRFLAEMVARFAGQEMRLFDSEAEALAWLVSGESDGGIAIGRAESR